MVFETAALKINDLVVAANYRPTHVDYIQILRTAAGGNENQLRKLLNTVFDTVIGYTTCNIMYTPFDEEKHFVTVTMAAIHVMWKTKGEDISTAEETLRVAAEISAYLQFH